MKNIDYVIKKVSKEGKYDEKIVDEIYRFYWRECVLPEIKSFDNTAINIPYVFTIHLSYFKVREEILNIIRRIRIIRLSTKFTEEKRNAVDTYYCEYLRKLLKRKNELSEDHNLLLKKIKKC